MLTVEERNAQIERLKNMTDEEIYQNALSDPDCPPLTDEELEEFVPIREIPGDTLMENSKMHMNRNTSNWFQFGYDADILAYFRAKGKGYQSMMNDALHAFTETEKEGNFARGL